MLKEILISVPDWVKSKLSVRIIYTASSFITARLVAFLTGNWLNKMTAEIVSVSGHVGVRLDLKVIAIDQRTLESAVTFGLMLAGEFLLHRFHENTMKPAILETQGVKK